MLDSRVQTALAWDLSNPIAFLVERKGMDPTYVARMALEYRRFIGIIVAEPDASFPVSEAVDEMWHTHILFTDDYRRMSNEVRGEYISHHPVMSEDARRLIIPHYLEGTLEAYQQLYGEMPSLDWWPLDGAICWSKGP